MKSLLRCFTAITLLITTLSIAQGRSEDPAPRLVFTGGILTGNWEQPGMGIDGEAAGDESGSSVSLSADGQTAIIGATNNDGNGNASGHARIFHYNAETSQWDQLGMDIDGEGTPDQSGNSVFLSADGTTAIIGAHFNDGNGENSGHARIYRYDAGTGQWVQLGMDIDGEAAFDLAGTSVGLSADGNTAIIGARFNDGNGFSSGNARVFHYDGETGQWVQLGMDIDGEAAGDLSGRSVALSADGKTAIIGSPNNEQNGSFSGHARIFRYDAGVEDWIQLGMDIDGEAAGDEAGWSVSLSADGETAIIGARMNEGNGSRSGQARIFRYDVGVGTGEWIQLGTDIDGEAVNDQSGWSVSLSADGETAIIGAIFNNGNGNLSGHTRIFRYDAGVAEWIQLGNDIDGAAASDASGISVSLSADGETAIIGALGNNRNGRNSGHARVYRFSSILSYTVPENTLTVTDADATDDRDSEGDGLTYSLSGADSGLFTVDENTGALTFSPAPDFGNPADDGADNIYNIQLIVTDFGGLRDAQNLEITVNELVDLELEVISLRSVIVAGGLPVDAFRVKVTNSGPSRATGVAIRQSSVLPAGVSIPSADPSSGNYSGGVWTLDLADGASETLMVFLQAQNDVPSGVDSMTYGVEISASEQPDSSEGNNVGSASISIANAKDVMVEITEAPELSLQAGLFVSKVTVTNNTGSNIPAQRLFAFGLPTDMTVHNATGTDSFGALPAGTPYLLSNLDLPAGGSVVFTVEFLRESLDPDFAQRYAVELLADDEAIDSAGADGIAAERMLRLDNGDFLIEFGSETGAEYAVEYSPDLLNWKRVTPTITAVANRTQWIDNGPTKTESHPSTVPQRFYRFVILIPAN